MSVHPVPLLSQLACVASSTVAFAGDGTLLINQSFVLSLRSSEPHQDTGGGEETAAVIAEVQELLNWMCTTRRRR